MLLKNLHIQKYRSLFDVNITVSNLNIIVGSNDSGKSNILRSVNALLQPNVNFSDSDYSMFPNLGGRGSVTDNSINITGKFQINQDAGSSAIKKALPNLVQINTVKRANDAYEVAYTYNDNQGRQQNPTKAVDAVSNTFLPKVISIDLADAYASLSNGDFGDLTNEISETFNRLTSAANRNHFKTTLNSFIKEFWRNDGNSNIAISSNDGSVEIDCTDVHSVSTALGQRGTGFQAFLFMALQLMNATYGSNDNKHDLVVLIEEPERMLHPQGQDDFVQLLGWFLRENPTLVIFITTHSPTIVRSDKTANILLVSKNNEGKSVVDKKPHMNNWKALRNSLGMRPSDSMLVGDISVIVEGACEQVFIPMLMQKYCDIDIGTINFVSAEGVTNITYYAQILRSMNTEVVAIFDNDKSGNKRNTELVNSNLIPQKNILMYTTTSDDEVAFEDLFATEVLIDAAKARYAHKIEEKKPDFSHDCFTVFCDESNIPDYAKKSWAVKMADYLFSLEIIDNKNDIDKFAICKSCVEAVTECPEQIKVIAEKLKKLFPAI